MIQIAKYMVQVMKRMIQDCKMHDTDYETEVKMADIIILPDDKEAKEQIIEVGRRMYDKDYCAANDGNISCKTKDGFFWVTPSGVSKGFMSEDILVKTDIDGNIIENPGNRKVSSELKLHLSVYKNRKDAGAVVHAHPPVSTAFACARKAMSKPVLSEAILNLGEVPCAPFAVPGTDELAESIIPYVKNHVAVLLANHGAVTWGESMIKAYYRLETLEYYAKMLIRLGELPQPPVEFTSEEKAAIEALRGGFGINLSCE